jgi:cell wall-associated NlpC family hydrolase
MNKHRRLVPHCHWKNAIAVMMAAVTAGAWIPFVADPHDAVSEDDEDEEFSVPAPIFEAHAPPTWPERAVPRVSLTKHPRPPHNPAVDPTHARPTPKVPVRLPRRPIPSPHLTHADAVINFLIRQLGKPYVFGGNGPNVYDCSGLTRAAFLYAGVYLPRTSEEQSLVGERVPLSELRPGDLVFWGVPGAAYHVGVYVGGGRIIAANNPSTGVVEFTVSYYPPSFARRIL